MDVQDVLRNAFERTMQMGRNNAGQQFQDSLTRKHVQTAKSEIAAIDLAEMAKMNLASEFHDRLKQRIQCFESSLEPNQEVGVQLVNFGTSITFSVTHVGFFNPSLIIFHGKLDNGNHVELIQHVSQLDFLLVAAKRSEPEQPKRRIGFCMPDSGHQQPRNSA